MQRKTLVVTKAMQRQIAGAVAEIDMAQIEFVRKMTPAERVRRAADMIEAAEQVGVYRLRIRNPELSEAEALKIVHSGHFNYQKRQQT
jgi:hypothetical protein